MNSSNHCKTFLNFQKYLLNHPMFTYRFYVYWYINIKWRHSTDWTLYTSQHCSTVHAVHITTLQYSARRTHHNTAVQCTLYTSPHCSTVHVVHITTLQYSARYTHHNTTAQCTLYTSQQGSRVDTTLCRDDGWCYHQPQQVLWPELPSCSRRQVRTKRKCPHQSLGHTQATNIIHFCTY